MKKSIVNILIVLCLVFLPCKKIYADEKLDFKFNVYAEPSTVTTAGDKSTLKVVISTDSTEPIMACSFSVNADSGVSLVEGSAVGKNNWTLTTSGSNYVIEADEGHGISKKNGEAGTVVLNLSYTVNNGSSKVTFGNIKCGEPDKDIEGSHDSVTTTLKVANGLNVKIDGVTVGGGIAPSISAQKTSFALTALSSITGDQTNVKVIAKDTATGDVTICSGEDCRETIVDFNATNFCTSSICNNFKIREGVGDNIWLQATINGSNVLQDIMVIKESTTTTTLDNTIASLVVWGIPVVLEKDKYDYLVPAPANVTDYTVTATLSDSTNFKWDADDNPSKYNFKTNTIILIVRPMNDNIVGATPRTYTINIIEEGPSSSSSSSNPSSSSSSNSKPITTPSSSSRPVISNPQTGNISQFIMATILIGSLFVSLIVYKNNMKEYQ